MNFTQLQQCRLGCWPALHPNTPHPGQPSKVMQGNNWSCTRPEELPRACSQDDPIANIRIFEPHENKPFWNLQSTSNCKSHALVTRGPSAATHAASQSLRQETHTLTNWQFMWRNMQLDCPQHDALLSCAKDLWIQMVPGTSKAHLRQISNGLCKCTLWFKRMWMWHWGIRFSRGSPHHRLEITS